MCVHKSHDSIYFLVFREGVVAGDGGVAGGFLGDAPTAIVEVVRFIFSFPSVVSFFPIRERIYVQLGKTAVKLSPAPRRAEVEFEVARSESQRPIETFMWRNMKQYLFDFVRSVDQRA